MTKKTDAVTAATESSTAYSIDIKLKHPLAYGDTTIEKLTLRRPMGGDLRGVKLIQLSELNSDVLFTLLPRIASPALTAAHVQLLDPYDTVSIMQEMSGFFQE